MENVPAMSRDTLGDLVERNAWETPDKTAFVFDDVAYSWRTVDRASDFAALALLDGGMRKGDHVGFWSMNNIDLVVGVIATMKVGAIPAVINYSYRSYEFEHVVKGAGLTSVCIGECKHNIDFWKIARDLQEQVGGLQLIDLTALMGKAWGQAAAGVVPPEDRDRLERAESGLTCDDVACITFTSGTTNAPKPVQLTYYNIVNDVLRFNARMHVDEHDVVLASLPMFHSSGMSGLLFNAAASRTTAVFHRMFRSEDALTAIERWHVTDLMAVPSMAELMVEDPHFDSYDLSSLRVAMVSGAVVVPAKMERMMRKLGIRHVVNAYGQTECAPIITTTAYDDDLATAVRTVGKPLPGVEMRIANDKTNEPVERGVVGEIQVRGFNTMKGYLNRDEEMAKKYSADGWLKTTDSGWLDETGNLYFASRISGIIIRHGENISPAEIEEVVLRFDPAITECKVVGVPDELVGEEVCCLLQADKPIDLDALRAHVREMLASYKCPRYVFQVDAFPMTATSKVSQVETKKLAQRLVEGLPKED